MKKKKHFYLVSSLLTLMTTQVEAGFQFTAPAEQQRPQIMMESSKGGLLPMMPAVPAGKVAEQPASSQNAIPTAPVVTMTEKTVEQNQPPEMRTGVMSLSQPMQSIQPQGYEVAVGFGNELPLVTALRQIIPSDYSYVLDKNTAVGKTVSWNGGQEWPVVLNAMLLPLGLNAQINDRIVNIAMVREPSLPKTQPQPMIAPQEPVQIVPQAPALVQTPESQISVSGYQVNSPTPLTEVPKSVIPETIMVEQDVQKPILPATPQEPETVQWMAQSGQSLKTVLEGWSSLAGVDLFWSSDYDYPLSSDVSINGEFDKAVAVLLDGFAQAQPKPTGRLHPNLPHGPAVLILETQEVIR